MGKTCLPLKKNWVHTWALPPTGGVTYEAVPSLPIIVLSLVKWGEIYEPHWLFTVVSQLPTYPPVLCKTLIFFATWGWGCWRHTSRQEMEGKDTLHLFCSHSCESHSATLTQAAADCSYSSCWFHFAVFPSVSETASHTFLEDTSHCSSGVSSQMSSPGSVEPLPQSSPFQ